jgi:hypothetical protein
MKFKAEFMGLSDSLFTKGQFYEFDDDDLSISVTRLMKDFVIVEDDVDDVKTVFRVGDVVYGMVYHHELIELIVNKIDIDDEFGIKCTLVDNNKEIESFTLDGKYYNEHNSQKVLSFTPYDLVNGGFSQNREDIGKDLRNNSTIDVGDWGYFWDNYDMTIVEYGKLLEIINGKQVTYIDYFGRQWENFSKSIPPHTKELVENK